MPRPTNDWATRRASTPGSAGTGRWASRGPRPGWTSCSPGSRSPATTASTRGSSTREGIRELWAGLAVDDLVGGTWYPGDGTVNPGFAALAFAKGAVDRGVRYVPGTTVTGFLRGDRGAVTGLATSGGDIDAETVVLAAGLWTSELARLAGGSVALMPAEHMWVMTEETPLAVETQPFIRDLDGFLYVRHYRGRLVIGAFEPDGRPLAPAGITTGGFAELGPDWDHIAPVLGQARRRIPGLEGLGFEHFLRAPESFTPDANFQLGPLPEVPGLFVAAGLNSQGIIFGPGVGRAAAAWILAGHPTMDLAEVDVARTGSWASQRRWLRERTVESLGSLYDMHWPGKQPKTARGLRRLPLHDAYRAAGAAFGQVGGLGAAPVLRARRPRPRDRLRLPGAVVVPGRARRGRGDAERRRAVRPHDLLEVPRPGPRGAGRAAAARDVGHRRRGRADRLHRSSPTSAAGSRWTRRSPASGRRPSWCLAPTLYQRRTHGPAAGRAAGRRRRHGRHLGLRDAPRRRAAVTRAARPADR